MVFMQVGCPRALHLCIIYRPSDMMGIQSDTGCNSCILGKSVNTLQAPTEAPQPELEIGPTVIKTTSKGG